MTRQAPDVPPGAGPKGLDLPVPSTRAAWAAVALITLVGAGLIAWKLDRGLWYDEIVTLIHSIRPPLGQILTHFPNDNDHLLYSVLAHLSTAVFGEQAWSVRLPAALFGIAAAPMLFVLGRRVASPFEGLAAALILAVSYHQVWFSQNARAYSLMLFLSLLGTWLLLAGLRERRWAPFVGYALVMAFSAYAHLTMALVAVGQALVVGVHLLVVGRGRLDLRQAVIPAGGFVLAALFTVLLYAPMLGDLHAAFGGEGQAARGPLPVAAWAVQDLLRGLQQTQAGSVLAPALVAGVCGVGVWSYARRAPTALALFLVPAIVVLAATVVLGRPIRPRFFFFTAGFLLLIAVRGALSITDGALKAGGRLPLVGLARPLAPYAAVAAMAAVAAASLPYLYRFPKQDFDGALAYVEANRRPGEPIYTLGIGTTLSYGQYYGRAWPELTSQAQLQSALGEAPGLWVVYTFRRYLDARLPELMAELDARCPGPKTFWGTLEDGVIVAARCQGAARAKTSA